MIDRAPYMPGPKIAGVHDSPGRFAGDRMKERMSSQIDANDEEEVLGSVLGSILDNQ